jgi:hypothetical protein
LGSHLDNATSAPDRVDNLKTLLDLMRHRLFYVHVLACVDGVDHHARMPVIGRGDNHGVEAFVIQQLAVIVKRFGPGGGLFQTRL